MATPFDSFNRSPLDAFIQSPLLARGALSGGSFSRTAALSFAITPTPTYAKYPRYNPFIPGTIWVKRYQNSGGSLVLLDEFTIPFPGNFSCHAGKSITIWRIERQRTQPIVVPANTPPSTYWRVRIRSNPETPPVNAEVYMAPQSSACDFDGPVAGWFLGIAYPDFDNYFDPGPLIPGQQYYLFFKVENDWSYIDPSVTSYYGWSAGNDGILVRLETNI